MTAHRIRRMVGKMILRVTPTVGLLASMSGRASGTLVRRTPLAVRIHREDDLATGDRPRYRAADTTARCALEVSTDTRGGRVARS